MKVKNGCFFYIEISLSGATEGIVWSQKLVQISFWEHKLMK